MLSPARLLMRGSMNLSQENFKFARLLEGFPALSRWSTCKFLWKPIELVIFQGDGGPDLQPSYGSAHASSSKLSSHTYVFFTLC